MSLSFPPRDTKKSTIARMIKGKYIKVPDFVDDPYTHDVPVDVYPVGHESTHVAFSTSFGEVHVRQFAAEVSQVAQEVEQAWHTALLAKNPVSQVD